MGYAEKRGSGSRPWRWRYEHGGRLLSESGFETKAAAERWGASVVTDQSRGVFVDPRGGRIPFREWAEAWMQTRATKESTHAGDRHRLRNHLLPALGHLTLEQVNRPSTVRRWVAGLRPVRCGNHPPGCGHRLSPVMVRHCYVELHSILADAAEEGLIRQAVTLTVDDLPEIVPREMVFLTEPQIGRLLAAMPPHYRPLVLFLTLTGMRWGEAVGLTVGRVDLLSRPPVAQVRETLAEVNGRLSVSSPKNRSSYRDVSLPPQLVEALVPLVASRGREEYVFTTVRGRRVRRREFHRNVWLPAVEKAGLVPRPRPHDLRHTHVSLLVADRHAPLAISRRLGHASISITMDRYGHLFREVDDAMLETLGRVVAPISLPLNVPQPG